MVLDSVKRAVEQLHLGVDNTELGSPLFNDKRSTPFPFELKNFRKFSTEQHKQKIAFIDGGNAEILRAPNFSIQLTKVSCVIFQENKRVNSSIIPPTISFFTVCHTKAKDSQISYKTVLVPISDSAKEFLPSEKDLEFDSFDRTLMNGSSRASIYTAGSSSRRFAEWKLAAKVIEKELNAGDILVRDGSLQTSITNENSYAEHAYHAAVKKNVIFTGLAKTSELFTTTGYSLLAAITKLSKQAELGDSRWIYYPIVKNEQPDHKAEMFVVKLNPASGRVFRFEILSSQSEKMSESEKIKIASVLAENSSDVSFPGYPYGLILADLNSRVRSQDANCLKLLFSSEFSNSDSGEKFFSCIDASDAHDILNKF